MQAYHNDPALKADIIAQLEAHRKADQLVKGQYWQGGKGCAVGCTIHSGDHMEYEDRFGIPVMIARLEDAIFEGLPNEKAMVWPVRLMSAIKPGQDLSLVGWKFLHRLMLDLAKKEFDADAKSVIRNVAVVIEPATRGEPVDSDAACAAAGAAAYAAHITYAARAAAYAARTAAAADAVAYAARVAADDADASYERYADWLIEIIEGERS